MVTYRARPENAPICAPVAHGTCSPKPGLLQGIEIVPWASLRAQTVEVW